jgi:excisionase family DNA binding protein
MTTLLTIDQVAQVLAVSSKTVRRIAAADRSFPVLRCGRLLRVPAHALERWVSRQLPRGTRAVQPATSGS